MGTTLRLLPRFFTNGPFVSPIVPSTTGCCNLTTSEDAGSAAAKSWVMLLPRLSDFGVLMARDELLSLSGCCRNRDFTDTAAASDMSCLLTASMERGVLSSQTVHEGLTDVMKNFSFLRSPK
jgi:hypothetical protein